MPRYYYWIAAVIAFLPVWHGSTLKSRHILMNLGATISVYLSEEALPASGCISDGRYPSL